MNVVQLMVTIIIVTILVTVILGVVSYIAYWLRRSRRPMDVEEAEPELRFFYRYVLECEDISGNGRGGKFADAVPNRSSLPAGALATTGSGATTIAS